MVTSGNVSYLRFTVKAKLVTAEVRRRWNEMECAIEMALNALTYRVQCIIQIMHCYVGVHGLNCGWELVYTACNIKGADGAML